MASEMLKELRARVRWLTDKFAPAKDQAFKAHRSVCALETEAVAPFKERDKRISKAMGDWELAERRRQAEERQRQLDELRKQEEERLLQQAIELERAGHKEEAAQIVEAPVTFIAPPPPPKPEKAQGVSSRAGWDFVITDEKLIPRAYLIPNHSAIRAAVNSMGPEAQKLIPGIAVSEKLSYATRR